MVIACRGLYGASDGERKESVASLSSAKLALKGVLAGAKVQYYIV